MKTVFTTDGEGKHQITMTPENDIEKLMVETMKTYNCRIEVSRYSTPEQVPMLEVTFTESQRIVAEASKR